jgi:hypothetical protein
MISTIGPGSAFDSDALLVYSGKKWSDGSSTLGYIVVDKQHERSSRDVMPIQLVFAER